MVTTVRMWLTQRIQDKAMILSALVIVTQARVQYSRRVTCRGEVANLRLLPRGRKRERNPVTGEVIIMAVVSPTSLHLKRPDLTIIIRAGPRFTPTVGVWLVWGGSVRPISVRPFQLRWPVSSQSQ
uniref:Uncharacterized protein n=1 Tax=Cacopsylla melanoneura TaxID=428564 RepID=A0A8D8PPS9_9HEMI